jgi:hypothetical protein
MYLLVLADSFLSCIVERDRDTDAAPTNYCRQDIIFKYCTASSQPNGAMSKSYVFFCLHLEHI